jgi:lipopolysaccharide/colanic/teichoic acid biosynthesis glycosyltransferase
MYMDTKVRERPDSRLATDEGQLPAREWLVFFGAGLCVVLWMAVSVALLGGASFWFSMPETRLHVALNLFGAGLAAAYAAQLRGSLDYKLGRAVLGAGLIFGVYALFILALRLFFSRSLLVASFADALIVSLGIVWFRHRLTRHKVALIAPLLGNPQVRLPPGRLVHDPATNLQGYDTVLVSLAENVSAKWAQALSRAMLAGCEVRHVGEYLEGLRGAVSLEYFEIDHVSERAISAYRPFKRAFDVAVCLFFLPVVIPAFVLAALGVLLTSGGPVFFVQDRVGLGGRPFKMWKLRTMRDQPADEQIRAAVAGDNRITPFGRILRRFRLDELPQLWNVLMGDMSLIGPRPEALPLHDVYLSEIPHYAYRYLVRPGITGWAQVSAPPSTTVDQAERKLTYDLYYVKRLSLALDAQIVIRTFWVIAHGMGVH